jgi:RES domain-containing protein
MLEYFVHLDPDDPPDDLLLAVADVPDDLQRERLDIAKVPPTWRQTPSPAELARFGDEFVTRREHCALIVPSALSPNENNWLLNPTHPDFANLTIVTEPLRYDPRMFRGGGRRRKH